MSNKPPSVPPKSVAIYLWFLSYPFVSSTYCHSGIYGTPDVPDCEKTLGLIPYALSPPLYRLSQQLRKFSEPQFLQPPFSAVDNVYRRSAIIQLPKIYK